MALATGYEAEIIPSINRSRCSSLSIVTGPRAGLARVWIPSGARFLFLLRKAQNGSGTRPAWVPRVQRPELLSVHSPPLPRSVSGVIPPFLLYAFMAGTWKTLPFLPLLTVNQWASLSNVSQSTRDLLRINIGRSEVLWRCGSDVTRLYRCTVHFVFYLTNTPTNAHI